MYDQLKRFFENSKLEGTKCEKILGNSARVSGFAQFYKKYADEIAVVSAVGLLNYLNGGVARDSKESQAFKEGLAQLPLFLEMAFKEIESKRQQESSPASSKEVNEGTSP